MVEEYKEAEHRRQMLAISDKLDIKEGSIFFLEEDNSIVLLGPEGKKGIKLVYEGGESKKKDFLKMICYLLNREIDVISKRDSAELLDLLPTGSSIQRRIL
jgi:hypothetical protein